MHQSQTRTFLSQVDDDRQRLPSMESKQHENVPSGELSGGVLSRPLNILQIGLGLHWGRTIRPQVWELAAAGYNVRCLVGVDLADARDAVESRLAGYGHQRPEEIVYLSPDSAYTVDALTEATLNKVVRKYSINAVAVSVPPEAHFGYAHWVLRKGLHLFLDKPVSARPDTVTSLSAARGILDDYLELKLAYERALRKSPVCAMLNVQRPFMPAYTKMLDWIGNVREASGQVVTNVTACHADGHLRVGGELLEVSYHGFRGGNGKLSHSGYHLIDMIVRMLKAGTWVDARPDLLLVRSSFRQPDALVAAMPRAAWRRLFGEGCATLEGYTDAELFELGRRMGEVDAHVCIEAVRHGALMTTANLHLQHDSVSARSTLEIPKNWYKSSGRLKRELWHVDQGPMQSIRVEALQAEDKHDRPDAKGDEIGDPNHLDLVRVQNEGLVGAGERLSRNSGTELAENETQYLLSERAKMASLAEFVACAQGRLPREELTSDLSFHNLGVAIMAAAYESHVRRGPDRMGDGVIRVDWTE